LLGGYSESEMERETCHMHQVWGNRIVKIYRIPLVGYILLGVGAGKDGSLYIYLGSSPTHGKEKENAWSVCHFVPDERYL